MQLDDKMDHGPILAQEKITLDATETAEVVHDKLSALGAELLIKILPDYSAGRTVPKPQDEKAATYTEKLTKEDGKIDWTKPAEEIHAHVRAMNPWPGAWTEWKGKKLIIWEMSESGQIKNLQLEGGKRMAIDKFLRGHPDFTAPSS